MKECKRFRDYVADPFIVIAFLFLIVAVRIGGRYTVIYLEEFFKE
jgi:hypothetical protein